MSVKQLLYSALILMVALLSACDDDGNSDSSIVNMAFSASPLEGFAPLTVTFSTDNPQPGMVWDFGDDSAPIEDTRRLNHVFEVPGVYTVTLTAVDDSGNVYTASKEITVNAKSNLVVTNFAISATGSTTPTTEVRPYSVNTVSATIQNIGDAALTGSGQLHVGYFLSRDQNITVDDIYIGDTTIVLGSNQLMQLNAQEVYSYNHQLLVKPNIPSGNYYAGAIVDYIDNYSWYDFPSATDTLEYSYPSHITVAEINENDNVSAVIPVTVTSTACVNDPYEGDNNPANATVLVAGVAQSHNLCFDNSDWFKFTATQGNIYKITVEVSDDTNGEIDPQLILYNQDGREILLFHDNIANWPTNDLESGWCTGDTPKLTPATHRCANAEIVWNATASGTYFLKVRTAACDEDKDDYCTDIDPASTSPNTSPDGVGNNTGYTITLR